MDRNQLVYRIYVDILRSELICAMGCTEPIALAYCAATARAVLGCLPDYSLLTVEQIYDFACTCDLDDVREILDRQIECNTAIAEDGLVVKGAENSIANFGRLPETETHSGGGPLWHSAFFIRLPRCMTETAGC